MLFRSIVVLSGQNDEAHPRYTRTMGAVEFVARIANPLQLKNVLMQALSPMSAQPSSVIRLLGESEPICKLCEQIVRFAPSLYPILVLAECGNGKELVARALHEGSVRAPHEPYALTCAAIAPTLVKPALFSYAKGSFTGANSARSGHVEYAHDSTLMLEEIG